LRLLSQKSAWGVRVEQYLYRLRTAKPELEAGLNRMVAESRTSFQLREGFYVKNPSNGATQAYSLDTPMVISGKGKQTFSFVSKDGRTGKVAQVTDEAGRSSSKGMQISDIFDSELMAVAP